jgi:hypothetical protein
MSRTSRTTGRDGDFTMRGLDRCPPRSFRRQINRKDRQDTRRALMAMALDLDGADGVALPITKRPYFT